MQINVDVHNYMETLVGNKLAEKRFTEQYDNDQLADLACLTLNQLRPIYIRFDIDFLSRLETGKRIQYEEQVTVAVEAAETMIKSDRRIERTEEEVIFADSDEEKENRELEWYEEPILKPRSR